MVMGYYGAIFIAWGFLDILGAGISVRLFRRVWARPNTGLAAKAVASLLGAAVLFGAFQTLRGLCKVFGVLAGQNADPSQAASTLAEGLSEAMNCTAFTLAVGVPSAFAAWFITRRSKLRMD